jgi:hypothetical protein
VAVGASGLLLAGCNEAPQSTERAADGSVGKTSAAWTAFNMYILNVTNAAVTNLDLTFEASVGATTHYLDSESVTPTLYPPNTFPRNCSSMHIRDDPSNELQQASFNQACEPGFPNHSHIIVTDYSVPKFALAKIKITGFVNGECFEDWEVVDWLTPPTLFLNASGGTSNGTCKLGNFLQPYQ